MMNQFTSWQRKNYTHPYNVLPRTFISSALSCDQFNPSKPLTLHHLLWHFSIWLILFHPPKYSEWSLVLCPELTTQRTNLAILGRAICKRYHRRTEHLVRPVIDVRNNRDNRPRWTAAGVVYPAMSDVVQSTHKPNP